MLQVSFEAVSCIVFVDLDWVLDFSLEHACQVLLEIYNCLSKVDEFLPLARQERYMFTFRGDMSFHFERKAVQDHDLFFTKAKNKTYIRRKSTQAAAFAS